MSLSWPAVPGDAINITVATLGAVGTGSFTIVALTNLNGANHGVIGLSAAGTFEYQVLSDTGTWFGGGDFSGFAGTPGAPVVGDWQIIGQSKTGGTNAYRWHFWDYTTGSAKVHTAGSGTHADPGTITGIQLGNSENRGNGLIAAIAIWKRVLSDAEFDSLCTTKLSDWMAVSGGQPDAIWALNVAAASVVDGTGHGNNASSVVGTISAGADPPGFDYSLTAAVVAAGNSGATLPPHLVQQLAAQRAAQFAPARGAEVVNATAATAALGALTAAATGTPTVNGTAAAALGALAAAATGVGSTPPLDGTSAPTLPPYLVQQLAAARAAQFAPARGAEVVTAVAATATLGALAAAATGTPTVNGTAAAALGGLAAAATGTGVTPIAGYTPQIDPRTVQQLAAYRAAQFAPARGAEVVTATAATATLGGLNAAASSSASTVNGTATATLGALTAAATGRRTTSGTAAAALGRVAAGATGVRSALGATAAATLGALMATAAGPSGETSLAGNAHGPLPIALGSVIVHTGTIAGAIT